MDELDVIDEFSSFASPPQIEGAGFTLYGPFGSEMIETVPDVSDEDARRKAEELLQALENEPT